MWALLQKAFNSSGRKGKAPKRPPPITAPLLSVKNVRYPSNSSPFWREKHLQEAVADFLERLEAVGALTFNHSPLEGKRTKRAAVAMKRAGAKKGHPDLEVYLSQGRVVLIELKCKGSVQPAQKERHDVLRKLGHDVRVVKAQTPGAAVDLVKSILRGYGYGSHFD